MVFLHAGNKHDGQEKKSLEQNWSRTFLFCFVFFHQGVGKSPNYCLAFCLALLYHTLLTKPLITSLELHQLLSGPLANLWGTWWRGVCVFERDLVYMFAACPVDACLCLYTTQWKYASLFVSLCVCLCTCWQWSWRPGCSGNTLESFWEGFTVSLWCHLP